MRGSTRISWWALLVLTGFSAVSAFGGGVAILVTGGVGMGMPMSLLAGSTFASFTMTAIVLAMVVGGTQALAFAALLRRWASALLWAAIAGFGMTIWIISETVMINGFSALQGLYLVVGLIELALVIALLGVVSWIPALTRTAPPKRGHLVKN